VTNLHISFLLYDLDPEFVLGLRCGRALKNQLAGSSKAMRQWTEAKTWKGVKLYDIIRIRESTLNKNTD
jgi:hypothetical protein